MATNEGDEVVQYLIHPALRPRLDAWLTAQGLRVDRLPPEIEGKDSLPTFLVAVGDDLMRSIRPIPGPTRRG